MEIKRRPFQGVLNILSFNRHFYFYGLAVLAVIYASSWFIKWPSIIFWITIIAFIYGLVMPLLVSAYMYDLSGFYRFDWLQHVCADGKPSQSIVNINAGFDETSFILQSKFPGSEIKVFDFYNAKRHTEAAIKRARKVSHVFPGTKQIESGSIPLQSQSADIVFLLSAAHEIRSHEEKIRFLQECKRLCKAEGKVVMVEHLRDFPNFLAFTIGFTHFFSSATWKNAFEHAGFSSFNENKFTPFMSVISCKP